MRELGATIASTRNWSGVVISPSGGSRLGVLASAWASVSRVAATTSTSPGWIGSSSKGGRITWVPR